MPPCYTAARFAAVTLLGWTSSEKLPYLIRGFFHDPNLRYIAA